MFSPANATYREAVFIERLNRFVARVYLDGTALPVRVPNTGRLAELFIPGTPVILVPSNGKYSFTIQYVIYKGRPVLIDSILSNRVFRDCMAARAVPGLEEYSIIKREPAVGNHRFDYTIGNSGKDFFVEIKSCTLAWRSIASFPDAVSDRASEHVRVLAESGKGILVFLLLHENVDLFVPNYHTDFFFYKTLLSHGAAIDVRAYAARYDSGYRIMGMSPVRIEIPDVEPRGVYAIVLHNGTGSDLAIGGLGVRTFPRGYYIYIGSGMNNLFKRIGHHRRRRKKPRWHIDYLTVQWPVRAALPIVTGEKLECALAGAVEALGYRCVEGFGSSDCGCRGHLFHGESDPLHDERFIDMIYSYRYGGLLER
jgi:sugar fermentation stimulation protein A